MIRETIDILRKADLFSELSDEVLSALAKNAIEKRVARNEIIFFAGDDSEGLYVIAEGSVRAFRTGVDGREQTIHVERAVTTIAEPPVFDDGKYPSTAAAEEPSRLLFLPKDKIRDVCFAHPELALAAARLLAKRLRKCAELVESLSLREVGQRLADVILTEAAARGHQTAEGTVFTLSLTHNQLAARVGTVREVVTRALLRLQQQGLISVSGKKVLIQDRDALGRYAGVD